MEDCFPDRGITCPNSLHLRDIWDRYHDVKCKLRINYAITSHHARINADLIHERSLLVMDFKLNRFHSGQFSSLFIHGWTELITYK